MDGAENGAREDVQVGVVEREADDVKQGVAQRGCSRVREGCLCGEVLQKVHRKMCSCEMERVDGVPRGVEPNVRRGVRGEDVIGFEVRGVAVRYGRHEGRDAERLGSERGDRVRREAEGEEVRKHDCVPFFDGSVKGRGRGERGVRWG